METLKERAIREVRSGVGKMNINLAGMGTDPDIKAFNEGHTTLVDLISSEGPDKNYMLLEIYDHNWTLIQKDTKLGPLSRVNPTTLDRVWEPDSEPIFLHAYPELTLLYKDFCKRINEASCSGCQKNTLRWKLLQNILALDNSKRELEPLKPIFGTVFCDIIKITPPEPVPPEQQQQQQPTQHREARPVNSALMEGVGKYGPRPTCFSCCKKHVGQAIVLLGEVQLGYPLHRWIAIGHLAEASEEALREYPDLATDIRAVRLRVQDDLAFCPDLVAMLMHIESYEKGHIDVK